MINDTHPISRLFEAYNEEHEDLGKLKAGLEKYLAKKRRHSNIVDRRGQNPLHWLADDSATMYDDLAKDIAELLLKNGTKLGERDNEGRTPISYASETTAGQGGELEGFFISRGGDPFSEDNRGIYAGSPELVQNMIDEGKIDKDKVPGGFFEGRDFFDD